ncbi:MAG: hypothetical protein H5T96_07595 [Tissierellales bacterium]|nr:hypothetical protein [Tissierellales bacterium]
MYYSERKSLFDIFFENRSSLILKYENGDISKKEFLENNYLFVKSMRLNPFLKVDSFEKGMYNYQYYNVLAKYYKMLSKEIKGNKKQIKSYVTYLNKANNYYHLKDNTILEILKLINFNGAIAYFIQCESKSLSDKLYEIVLLDYKEAIFHSKATWLLEILMAEGIFDVQKRKSIIDEYINEKY